MSESLSFFVLGFTGWTALNGRLPGCCACAGLLDFGAEASHTHNGCLRQSLGVAAGLGGAWRVLALPTKNTTVEVGFDS